MASLLGYIDALESYATRSGARLVRCALPDYVHGRVSYDLITLRHDLNPEQQLLVLVHELAHWLAHRGAASGQSPTVLEYEAEAVESVVMARIGLPHFAGADDCPTDDLLSASVVRVNWASNRICDALGLADGSALQP